ncbi:zinc-binding alcohol dehydrogenase family protein [Epidermidibacterium keratini]
MRALRPDAAGDPADLRETVVDVPAIGADDVLVEVRAASINRSDMLACRGVLPGPFPRILGRDFAGVVIEGPESLVGTSVWGSGGGDLGLDRDGTYAQYLAVSRDALTALPQGLSFVDAAASALAFFTAAYALRLTGQIESGSTFIATGAAGGVGGAAAAIARGDGAHVVAVVRNDDEAALVREAGFDTVVIDGPDIATDIAEAVGTDGAAAAVDAVGGKLAGHLLRAMGQNGRYVLLSTPPDEVPSEVDLLDLYRKSLVVKGLYTGRVSAADAAEMLRELTPRIEDGSLPPVRVDRTYPLAEAATAFGTLGPNARGRAVLLPHGSESI